MGDMVIGSLTRFSEIIKGLKDQINEIDQIKQLVKSHLPTFTKALERMNDSLEMLTYVFQGTHAHTELFNHKLLNFSQIDMIVVKLKPLPDLLRLLSDLNRTEKFVDRMKLYWQIYRNYDRPSLIRAQLKRHFNIIEGALPVIIELNRTVFGSATRIKQPVLRKAWMLAGENQLNDSSLPINILQDNLYMLLKLEIGERTINSTNKKTRYKTVINQIMNDIDNRGVSDGDGNISLAELNDLPDDVMEDIHSGGHDIDPYDDTCVAERRVKPLKSRSQTIKMLEDTCNWICACSYATHKRIDPDLSYDDVIEEADTAVSHVKCKRYIVRATDFFDRYRAYLKKIKKLASADAKSTSLTKNKEIMKTRSLNTVENEPDDPEVELEGLAALFSENIQVDVPIILCDSPRIDGKSARNTPPKSTGDYGHNFISKKIASLVIKSPNEFNRKLSDKFNILTTVTFTMIASDQGWGGSNNAHVRYQINEDNCVKAFTITRRPKDNLHGEYTFTINGYELNKNPDKDLKQTIHIWLYCPPWSGWEATVHEISCEINYN